MINVDKMNRRVTLLRPESPLDEINGCDTMYIATREVWAEFLKPDFVSRAIFGDRGTRSLQEIKELFTGDGMVAYVMKERIDGKLGLAEAVQLLKIKG